MYKCPNHTKHSNSSMDNIWAIKENTPFGPSNPPTPLPNYAHYVGHINVSTSSPCAPTPSSTTLYGHTQPSGLANTHTTPLQLHHMWHCHDECWHISLSHIKQHNSHMTTSLHLYHIYMPIARSTQTWHPNHHYHLPTKKTTNYTTKTPNYVLINASSTKSMTPHNNSTKLKSNSKHSTNYPNWCVWHEFLKHTSFSHIAKSTRA